MSTAPPSQQGRPRLRPDGVSMPHSRVACLGPQSSSVPLRREGSWCPCGEKRCRRRGEKELGDMVSSVAVCATQDTDGHRDSETWRGRDTQRST